MSDRDFNVIFADGIGGSKFIILFATGRPQGLCSNFDQVFEHHFLVDSFFFTKTMTTQFLMLTFLFCQGSVVGLPEQQLDNVPIQLTCQKCKNDNQIYEDLRYRQSLWENFHGVVRNGNLQQPSSARYQTNFNTMITDVMTNHTHLFSDKETSFLGLIYSLPITSLCFLIKKSC